MIRVEAGVELAQIGQGPHEQSRACQQEHGEEYLRGDQPAAQAGAATTRGLLAQRPQQIGAARSNRRRKSEQQCGDGAHHQRESQNAQVGCGPQI
jgi:hypothetical protein